MLNSGISFVVCGCNFGGGLGVGCGLVMEQARGQGTADALVKADESGGQAAWLGSKAVGILLAHPLQEAVALPLA